MTPKYLSFCFLLGLGGRTREEIFRDYVGMWDALRHCCCPLQENSNFQVWYWTNSTEPTLFAAAESDGWNNLTHPSFPICLWPVAMVPSLTPLQPPNRCYPSGRSQDDPYHSNLVPSPLWLGGQGCAVLIEDTAEKKNNRKEKKKRNTSVYQILQGK